MKLPFSSGKLVSVVWKSVVLLGELQVPPGEWQPKKSQRASAKAGELEGYENRNLIGLPSVPLELGDQQAGTWSSP